MTESLTDRGPFRWRWALPLVPIAASMFCLSALVYYHTAMGGTGAAWGFLQGVVVFCYRWLGFVPTFMFWLLLFIWCSIWFVVGRWENVRARLLWMVAFTLCTAILVNLGTPADAPPHAGLVGTFIASRLTSVVGHALGALLAVAASLASLLLATDFLFYRYFEALARGRTEETGVEPEATDAFRELAFAGVYAGEPLPVRTTATERAGDVPDASSEGVVSVEAPVAGFATDVEPDIIVRPRRRMRERLAREQAEAEAVQRTAEEAASQPRVGAADPAMVEVPVVGAGLVVESAAASAAAKDAIVVASEDDAAPEEVEPIGSADGEDGQGEEAEAVVVDAGDPVDPTVGEAEADDPADDEARDVADEPVVEIPRVAPRRQGNLFPAAVDDRLDRAAREVLAAGRASVTLLRRHLGCSAGEALELLDRLREIGVIDGEPGSPNGRVAMTLAEWEAR